MSDKHNRTLEDVVAMRFARRRRELRIKRKDLAKSLGVSGISIYYWENGIAYPESWARWNAWARAVRTKPIINVEA